MYNTDSNTESLLPAAHPATVEDNHFNRNILKLESHIKSLNASMDNLDAEIQRLSRAVKNINNRISLVESTVNQVIKRH